MLEGRNFFRNRQVLRNVNFYTILAILAAPWVLELSIRLYNRSMGFCLIPQFISGV